MDEQALRIIRDMHELFSGHGLTIALAESCTGGLVSHYMTLLPGSSAFFQAGLVTYSNASKARLLGFASGIIEKYGVISAAAACEMAEKTRALLDTDFALATTGNLGPDALEGKERGIVFIAVSTRKETVVRELRLAGDRMSNKEQAALAAMQFLLETAKSEG